MANLRLGATEISYDELRNKIDNEFTGTISKYARPTEDEFVWKNSCTLKLFLECNTHPVWYMDPAYINHRAFNAEDATKIRFIDAINQTAFLKHFNNNRHPEIPYETLLSLIVFHCSRCNNYAVIDGNHRLTRYILSGNLESQIFLYGLSGSGWPAQTRTWK